MVVFYNNKNNNKKGHRIVPVRVRGHNKESCMNNQLNETEKRLTNYSYDK